MEPWCYFSGDKEYVCDKSVSASSENGGENSGLTAFSEAEEKPSSLFFDSNSRDSSLVDLKLGSTSDQKDNLTLNSSISNQNSSCSIGKRSQIPLCQVYGCKKDLRSSKDYYKRHKVCEIHSKMAKVIVNGVEQRFCQQCSRFHMPAEFDNGKRSCRRRLAGHNERRRKPRAGVNSNRWGIFQDYSGSRIQDTTSTSSIWRNRPTSSRMYQQKYDVDDWNAPAKLEYGADFSSQIYNPVTTEQLHSKCFLIPYLSEEQRFPLRLGDNNAHALSKNNEINELSMQDHVTCSDIGSTSLFHNSSVSSKNSVFMDSSSSFQELLGMPSSGHALSLLSSLSQDSSDYLSSRAHSSHPLVASDGDASYDLREVSQKLLAVSSEASTNGMTGVSHSSWRTLSEHHRR